jgi:hypothetical protein
MDTENNGDDMADSDSENWKTKGQLDGVEGIVTSEREQRANFLERKKNGKCAH